MLYDLYYLEIYVHIASNGLRGHVDLLETSEASKQPQRSYDLRFDISNLDYPGIHAHIASNSHFGGLWGHGDLQMTSEVKADLKIELSDLNYLCSHASLACKGFLEMIQTDKQPIMIHRPACFAAGKNVAWISFG